MSGELDYAGESWRWELKTIKTPVRGIVRLEARVALEGAAENSWPGFATGFMGNALAPPGGPPYNILGDAAAGTQPGQEPPTPGEPPEPSPSPEPPEQEQQQ